MQNNLVIGWGEADITPKGTLPLNGQFYRRFASAVESPLRAIAAVFGEGAEAVIWVACDLLNVPYELTIEVSKRLSSFMPQISEKQIILSATHTHTGPFLLSSGTGSITSLLSFRYDNEEITMPEECFSAVADGIVKAILEADANKCLSYVETAVLRVQTGYNRRSVYTDGSAVMYGSCSRPDFVSMEGRDGGTCSLMYVYNKIDSSLSGVIASIPCTAQVLEHASYVSSDYWSYVRENIRIALGTNVKVLGLCSSAGDLSPRDLIYTAENEPDMHDICGCKALARVISDGIIEQQRNILSRFEGPFIHGISEVDFPLWQSTEQEFENAVGVLAEIEQKYDLSPKYFNDGSALDYNMCFRYCEAEVQRQRYFSEQKYHRCSIHALRIGNAVLLTNPFELFIAYAIRIRAALPGVLMFDSQLSVDSLGYLPTREAISHGGYSGMIFNGITNSSGGDLLVRESISLVKNLYI